MDQLKKQAQFIEQYIQELKLPAKPKNLYDPLNYFLSLGGKRIRPLLTLLSTELFGTRYETSIHAALAIEYFHNFSLIHDDIMDEAPLRRKKETVHKKWNNNIAILSGDVLLVVAYQELNKQNPKHLHDLLTCFNQTAIEVCEGQQLDMDFEKIDLISVEDYIEMIRLKTSVLLGCALKLGAIVADASTKNQELIYNFGVNLGIAFQIQDDYLDLFANPDTFGKQVGGDIISNKKTLLTLKAKEIMGEKEFNSFTEDLNLLSDIQKVEQAKNIFSKIGVKELVLEKRDSYFNLALNDLNKIETPTESKHNLFTIVDFLKEREV